MRAAILLDNCVHFLKHLCREHQVMDECGIMRLGLTWAPNFLGIFVFMLMELIWSYISCLPLQHMVRKFNTSADMLVPQA